MTGLTQSSTTSPLCSTGINTYTSATTIGAGATLQLGNQTTNNQIFVTGTTIADAGTLIFAPGTTDLYLCQRDHWQRQHYTQWRDCRGAGRVNLTATTGTFTGTYTLNQGRLVVTLKPTSATPRMRSPSMEHPPMVVSSG